jgi:hypothetical protein
VEYLQLEREQRLSSKLNLLATDAKSVSISDRICHLYFEPDRYGVLSQCRDDNFPAVALLLSSRRLSSNRPRILSCVTRSSWILFCIYPEVAEKHAGQLLNEDDIIQGQYILKDSCSVE